MFHRHKPTPHPDLPERHQAAMELLCIAIARDSNLKHWFHSLVDCPENLRVSTLLQMTTSMRHDHEDDALIDAVSALCDSHLLQAVNEAVQSLS